MPIADTVAAKNRTHPTATRDQDRVPPLTTAPMPSYPLWLPAVVAAGATIVLVVVLPYTTHAPEKPAHAEVSEAVIVSNTVVLDVTNETNAPLRLVAGVIVGGGGGGGVGVG